ESMAPVDAARERHPRDGPRESQVDGIAAGGEGARTRGQLAEHEAPAAGATDSLDGALAVVRAAREVDVRAVEGERGRSRRGGQRDEAAPRDALSPARGPRAACSSVSYSRVVEPAGVRRRAAVRRAGVGGGAGLDWRPAIRRTP